MGKTTTNKDEGTSRGGRKGKISSKRKDRPAVQIVVCPTSFPNLSSSSSSSSRKKPQPQQSPSHPKRDESASNNLMDFHDAAREVNAFGSTAFTGKLARSYKDRQYFELTGRAPKKHSVPLPIVRGIKRKAKLREERLEKERKECGIVMPSGGGGKKKKGVVGKGMEERRRMGRVHGPAPDVGYMKKGVLKVRKR